jgi:DNA mismatch endonuclease (patch repair protein)
MEKFRKNRERDLKTLAELEKLGWKVLVIWECQIRKGVYREILLEYFFPQKKKEQEQ